MSKFYARMQQRRGTAAEWTAANPILQAGEIGYETDTEQFKIGNGTDTWSALEYWEGALPDQTSNSGKFLTTDGTDAAWADVDTFPSQSGNSGYFLTTDGTAVAWAEVDALPTQTGNTGYYLKTDGTTASWDELSIDDLVAVSLDDIDGVTITGTPLEGQSLIYDSSTSQWINVESGGSVSVSATAPVGPDHGDMWWNSEDAVLYVYYVDVDADGYWVEATAGPLLNQALADLSDTNITSPTIDQTLVYNGTQWVNQDSSGGGLTVSATPPAGPDNGDMWWDPDNGNLYIYYTDVDSSQWVSATGPQVFVGTTAPAGYQGQLWFNSSTGKTYIYFDDGTSAQWVSAIGGLNIASSDLPAGSVLQVVSRRRTAPTQTTSTSYIDLAGVSVTITPTNSSSTFWILVTGTVGNKDASHMTLLNVLRGVTPILQSTGGGVTDQSLGIYTNSINSNSGFAISGFDAPASSDPQTYKIQFRVTGGTGVVGKNASTSDRPSPTVITVMEVAG